MKKKKCILLIDDKDQNDVASAITFQLRSEFDLDFVTIRTSAAELKKDDAEDIDIDKLKKEIDKKIHNKRIDVALTDFDLESEYVNGLDIVRLVHEIRNNVNFFIYSGNWDKVIETVIGKNHKTASTEELVGGINKLIHDNIINCLGRTEYKDELVKYIKKSNQDTIEHRLSALLRANGELKFESCFPEFRGLTFAEIADIIDNHSDARSDEWIGAVLTQTIAYLVVINHE